MIDGNRHIFTDSLLKEGLQGGRRSVQKITTGIAEYLSKENVHVFGRLSFWATVYFDKAGLREALVSHNKCTAEQFDAFCIGFSQASPRFLMIDVGPGQEAVGYKLGGESRTWIYYFSDLTRFIFRVFEDIYSLRTNSASFLRRYYMPHIIYLFQLTIFCRRPC